MTKIDFYKLSRPIQDGLLDACRGQFTPAPILTRPGTRRTVFGWLAVSYVAAVGLFALWFLGFGDVESRFALHPTTAVAAYVLLAAISILGLIQALAARKRLKALPFQPGLYLFPASLIDARDHKLRVYPLAELSEVSAGSGGAVAVRFGRGSFSFPVAAKEHTPELCRRVEEARDRMRQSPDAAARRKLDPLEPQAVESPLAPTTPLSRLAPGWERQRWVLAVVIGTNLGVGLFFVRNLMSDKRMFLLARTRDDVAFYKRYVERGRGHVDEVSRVLLPRAELRLAVAAGSVEAIDAFLRAYPSTGIQAEVDAARKAALVAEFERTRKVGTLAALLSFAERYPKHGIDKPFDQAKHALYVRAQARYKSEMPKGGDRQAEFVGKLLAHAERVGAKSTAQGLRGPTVQIRFRRLASQGLDRAEEQVMKSPMYAGVSSLPTRYLTATHVEPHEKNTAKALSEGFARGFDPEIVTFEPGPLLEGTAEEPLAVTSPTLAVSYRVESSGGVQARTRPRGIFLGLVFFFNADFLLPGDAQPLVEKYKLMQRVPLNILNENPNGAAAGVLEAAVYETETREAFLDFQGRYMAKWFPPRKDTK